jgi:hypothetical protein
VDARIITSAAAPSLMLELLAAVMVPSFLNAGLSVGILSSLTLPGPSSMLIHRVALAALDGDRRDLGLERARFGGGLGALHAGGGEGVLRLAGEVVLGGAVFAKGAHGTAGLVGVFQAVEHHVVVDAVVADAVPPRPLSSR